MRKRSKYRPKRVLINPVGYVIEGLTPITQHEDAAVNLKVKHHYAMASLTRGQATKDDVGRLINMANVTEALYRMGFGTEYKDVVAKGTDALLAVARRGAETDRYILRSEEMRALNELIELHDAQLEVITVKDVERAVALVENERKQKRMTPVVERK